MAEQEMAAPEGGQNLFPCEAQIRSVMGVALGALATGLVVAHSEKAAIWGIAILLGALAVELARTAVHRHCPMYAALGINADAARRSSYLALLPQHNPAPVLAFDRSGHVQFRNGPAEERFGATEELHELFQEAAGDPSAVVDQGEAFAETRDLGGRTYQLFARGVPQAGTLLAYAFDVTEVTQLQREMISTQKEVIHRMGEIGETRSQEVGNHVKRVAAYSRLLAEGYGLDPDQARILEMASPMHDIGKVGIPDRVLNKPGRLDEEEWALMKRHAEVGYELLRHAERPILQAAATVAHEHHERWDGTGYPRGLQGEAIHIFGRITALADVFDALGSDRVYKPAWSLEAILDLLREERGYHFDPTLVDLFLADLDRFLEVRDRYVDPG